MNTPLTDAAGKLRNVILILMLPLLSIAMSPWALANSGDTSSLQVSANQIKLETASRRVLYSGNVRIRHKSLTITGSRAVATSQNSGRGEVTISGRPVVAKLVDSTGRVIQMKSQSLAYNATTQSLLATGNVELQSGQDRLSGQKMQYDIANDRFSISGDQNTPRISAILKINENPAH